MPRQSIKVPRACKGCGKTFFVYPSQIRNGRARVFCSIDCHSSLKTPCICQGCGATFLAYTSNVKRNHGVRFCSPDCRPSTQVSCICEECGEAFLAFPSTLKYNSCRFCSPGCYHRARTIPLGTRFLHYVGPIMESGCILWTGCKSKDGYGIIGSGARPARNLLATRVLWEFANGPIPEGLFVLHECDHPPCINLAHLFLGTKKDNADDMVAKGRARKRTPGSRRWLKEQRQNNA